MNTLGRRLRTKRIELDATQGQVAQALGTQQSMVAMIEAGTAEPGAELHGRILRFLAGGHVPGKTKRGAYKKG